MLREYISTVFVGRLSAKVVAASYTPQCRSKVSSEPWTNVITVSLDLIFRDRNKMHGPNGFVQMGNRKTEKLQRQWFGLRVNVKMSDVNMATIQLEGSKQVFSLAKKDFKTGSRGFYGQGKMMAGGKNYQINIQCVEIGSKPKEKKE